MSSRDYWEKRALENRLRAEQQTLRSVRQIEQAYDRATAEIQKDIAYWLSKFADNNQISMTEAKKLLKADELKEFRWTVEEYIRHGENNLDGRWERQLVNASSRVHISRLESLQVQLRQHVEALSGTSQAEIESLLGNLYQNQYYHTAFNIQKGLGIGWDLQKLDDRKVKAVLSRPWAADGKVFSDRIWENKTRLLSELDTEITRTILTGKKWDDAIRNIALRCQVSKNQAARLVMTEAAAIDSVAQGQCYQDLNVEDFENVATLDFKTSEICREMDGKHFPMSEYKIGVTAPPFHPWCRTCTAPYFDDWEELGGAPMRAARDENGQGYELVPADLTYKEWEKRFVKIEQPYQGIRILKSGDTTVSESVWKQVNAAIDRLEQDFPTILRSVQQISFGSMSDAIGLDSFSVSRNGEIRHTVTFQQNMFSDEDALLKALKLDYQNGISYNTNRIESLVAHELGHAAHNELTLQRIGYTGGSMSLQMCQAFSREKNQILQEIYIAAFPDDKFPDITFDEIQDQVRKELGIMAHDSPAELIAQAFGNYYYGLEHSRIAKAIVEFFKEELK